MIFQNKYNCKIEDLKRKSIIVSVVARFDNRDKDGYKTIQDVPHCYKNVRYVPHCCNSEPVTAPIRKQPVLACDPPN